MKFYAGIGSRRTPPEVLQKMQDYAVRLQKLGYILRSGGAIGADQAFERLVSPEWKVILRPGDSTPEAEALASTLHPAWHNCSPYVKRLHGRNCQIILGLNLHTPVDFVISYSTDPKRGGTSLGMNLATQPEYKIQVFNLAEMACEAELETFIKGMEPCANEQSK